MDNSQYGIPMAVNDRHLPAYGQMSAHTVISTSQNDTTSTEKMPDGCLLPTVDNASDRARVIEQGSFRTPKIILNVHSSKEL